MTTPPLATPPEPQDQPSIDALALRTAVLERRVHALEQRIEARDKRIEAELAELRRDVERLGNNLRAYLVQHEQAVRANREDWDACRTQLAELAERLDRADERDAAKLAALEANTARMGEVLQAVERLSGVVSARPCLTSCGREAGGSDA